jgi:hypothetical protein
MPDDVVRETGEWWLEPDIPRFALQVEIVVLRRLVESMALGVPRDRLPEDERETLDDILGRRSDS